MLSISQSVGKCLNAALALSLIILGTRGVQPGSHSSSNSFLPCLIARYRSSGSVMGFLLRMGAEAPVSYYAVFAGRLRIIARMSLAFSLEVVFAAVTTGFATTAGSSAASVAAGADAAGAACAALAGASRP